MSHPLIYKLLTTSLIFMCTTCLSIEKDPLNLDKNLNKVSGKTARELQKEIPYLKAAGLGGSLSIDYVIEDESLCFSVDKATTKDEGFILVSRVVNKYLENFHKNEIMKKYLLKHDFTYKNLQIRLIIHDSKRNTIYHPGIHCIELVNGKLMCETVKASEKYYLETVSETTESYEEAAKRLGVWKEF